MTNPNKKFEAWGDSLGPDIEALVREMAYHPGYVIVSAVPLEESIAELPYVDKQEIFDVTMDGGSTVKYRVSYIEDAANETS